MKEKKHKPKDILDINEAMRSAIEHHQAGNLSRAETIYREILTIYPNSFDVLHYLGILYYQLGMYDVAIEYLEKALQITPNDPSAYFNLGLTYKEKGQRDKAIAAYEQSVQFNPNSAKTYYNLGVALQENRQYDNAIIQYQKALQIDASLPRVYYNLGIISHDKNQFDDAISYYHKALQLDPNLPDAHNNLGLSLREKGQLDDAIACYKKALQLDPYHADAYSNLGNAFREKGQIDNAITCYQKALQVEPDFHEAYNNLGVAFMDIDDIHEAIRCFQKSLQLKPAFAETYCNLVYLLQQTNDWQNLDSVTATLDGLTSQALDTGTKPAESPFLSITRHADLSTNFAIAKSWSLNLSGAISSFVNHFSFDDRKKEKTKLVIGYLSNEFRHHATAHLMLSLFGLHNRDEFKIYCYSYGKDDGTGYRVRIQHDCDKFVDIMRLSYTDAAKRIYEDQVDILVDLKGHTKDNRLSICALRPAPVQVGYLGFPGTTGADFIDYIITDKIVTPDDHAPYYSEKFVYMPHCYQVNDNTQPISNKEWTKENLGLPESGFVFCSFNHPYKIDPVMFDVWMRILQQVPGSILWLLFKNKTSMENLRREAEERGIQAERLIFAEMLPKDEHLARHRFANLSLDTRIVNGHTTTSDALWAGVPVITLQGGHFASRVSSSVLSAVGLPELITHSLEEYEARAVQLASNPSELQKIRQKLAEIRFTAPLFDTPRFVRNLETAYKQMWELFLAGKAPGQIEVLENTI